MTELLAPEGLVAEARAAIEAAPTVDALEKVRTDVLGKRSPLVSARKQLGDLAPEERKEAGRALNEARTAVEVLVEERMTALRSAERAEQLEAERLDLTEVVGRRRRGHLHPVTQAWQRLEDVFVGMGFTVAEGPEVESDWYNFEALNFPPGHTARDMHDTLYVNVGAPESTLLRTHTSPVQVRVMQSEPPPIYVVSPGRTYRRDTADATHSPVFHQIEGLVIDRGITFGDLAGTIELFVREFFGADVHSRLRPSYFPFTEPSAEFDVSTPSGDWLEMGGCGMVHPNVLSNCGIDPEEWSGFAFGFGIDRLAMQRHGIDDLRELLLVNDIRFLEQF